MTLADAGSATASPGVPNAEDGRSESGAPLLEVRDLTTDPGTGVMRHADAGYERAIEVARERGVRIPMLDGED